MTQSNASDTVTLPRWFIVMIATGIVGAFGFAFKLQADVGDTHTALTLALWRLERIEDRLGIKPGEMPQPIEQIAPPAKRARR